MDPHDLKTPEIGDIWEYKWLSPTKSLYKEHWLVVGIEQLKKYIPTFKCRAIHLEENRLECIILIPQAEEYWRKV